MKSSVGSTARRNRGRHLAVVGPMEVDLDEHSVYLPRQLERNLALLLQRHLQPRSLLRLRRKPMALQFQLNPGLLPLLKTWKPSFSFLLRWRSASLTRLCAQRMRRHRQDSFWGRSQFKFAIVLVGEHLWTTTAQSATPRFCFVEVKNGFYSLHLGDSRLQNEGSPASALVAVKRSSGYGFPRTVLVSKDGGRLSGLPFVVSETTW